MSNRRRNRRVKEEEEEKKKGGRGEKGRERRKGWRWRRKRRRRRRRGRRRRRRNDKRSTPTCTASLLLTSDHGSVWERGKVRHIHFISPLPLHRLFLLFFLLLFRVAPFTCSNKSYKSAYSNTTTHSHFSQYWCHSS